jgi:dihydrolipoamide dehydrogenase
MSSVFRSKPTKYDADVMIVGSGAGGTIAAHTLSENGQKVILVEQAKLGGDCINYSCIPTKALLSSIELIKNIEHSTKLGIANAKYDFNFEQLKRWANKSIAATGVNSPQAYANNNLKIVNGHAHFLDQYTVSVGLKKLSAKKFIIATGANQSLPKEIVGLDKAEPITYKDMLNIKKLPESIAIIGGGSHGYEYAQIFSVLGVKVHLFEIKNHLLPEYDSEVGDLSESVLAKYGVRVHTLSKVTAVKKLQNSLIIEHKNHGQTHKIAVNSIMLATGSSPNTDLGLENCQITYSLDGIKVNSLMQTNQKHIFAIGDVTGNSLNAGTAIKQGQIAAHNILHKRKKNKFSSRSVPHVTFGLPEIAAVGINEHKIKLTGLPYQTSIAPIGLVGRSITSNYQDGFVKIVASHNGVILGATIVAPHAGELISELSLAVEKHLKACDISNLVHPFSTWSEAVRVAASKVQCI